MSKRSKAKSRRHKKPTRGEQGLSPGEVEAIDEAMGEVPISDGSAGQRVASFGLDPKVTRAFGVPGQPATKLRKGGARPLAETLAEIQRADVPPPPGAAYEYLDRKLQAEAQPERGMGGNLGPGDIAADVMAGKAEARRMAMTAGVTPDDMAERLADGEEAERMRKRQERIANRPSYDNPVAELLAILNEDHEDDERMILEHLGQEKLQRFLTLRQRLLLLAESEVDASLEIAKEVSEMWNLIAEQADAKIQEGRDRVEQIHQLAAKAVRERNRGRVYDYMRSERLALERLEAL